MHYSNHVALSPHILLVIKEGIHTPQPFNVFVANGGVHPCIFKCLNVADVLSLNVIDLLKALSE